MYLSIAFHLRYLIKHLDVFMTVVHTYFYIVSLSSPILCQYRQVFQVQFYGYTGIQITASFLQIIVQSAFLIREPENRSQCID